MERGPVDVLVLSFPLGTPATTMVNALREPVHAGTVGIIDLVLITADDQGNLVGIDIEEGFPDEIADLNIDPHTLLSDDDLELVASSLGQDEQALVVAIENLWATGAAAKIQQAGGRLTASVRIPSDEVEAAFVAENREGSS